MLSPFQGDIQKKPSFKMGLPIHLLSNLDR